MRGRARAFGRVTWAAAVALFVALCVAAGCSKPAVTTSTETGASAPKVSWPADAPSPDAPCATHDDCWVFMWDAPERPDPCCDARVGFWPTTRAYAQFMRRFQDARCKGVRCESLPAPGAEPLCCAAIPRCVDKRCVGGCSDPTLVAPRVVWHSPDCRATQLQPFEPDAER